MKLPLAMMFCLSFMLTASAQAQPGSGNARVKVGGAGMHAGQKNVRTQHSSSRPAARPNVRMVRPNHQPPPGPQYRPPYRPPSYGNGHYRPSYSYHRYSWPFVIPFPIYYFSAPVTYIEQPVAISVDPVNYIEQPAVATQDATQYWYYCAATSAYYPYVGECPDGWMKVLPQP